ncbi:MAG: hypothetical protein ACM3JE_02155 [Betaproteobacteria bacterium]
MYRPSRKAIKQRRSNPETQAGQYMCPECGKVFDTKIEVDNHIYKKHKDRLEVVNNGFHTE